MTVTEFRDYGDYGGLNALNPAQRLRGEAGLKAALGNAGRDAGGGSPQKILSYSP